MNSFDAWQALPWIDAKDCLRLTEALAHFLWQGCAIAALYAIALLCLRRRSAEVRYVAGVLALVAMVTCPPLTLCVLAQWESVFVVMADDASRPVAEGKLAGRDSNALARTTDVRPVARQSFAEAAQQPASAPAVSFPSFYEAQRTATILAWASPYAAVAYLGGAALMCLRVAVGLWGGRRLGQSCVAIDDARILDVVRRQAARWGLRVVPVVAQCGRVAMPVVVGLLRPTILLPAVIVSGLSGEQLEAVLLHELAHVRRYDPIANLLQRIIEAVLFFHPAVWWVSRRVSIEREMACDDLVLRASVSRWQYAEALVRAAELCAATSGHVPRAALAATGGGRSQFQHRVRRLLGAEEPLRLRLSRGTLAVVLLATVLSVSAPAWLHHFAVAAPQAAPEPAKAPDGAKADVAQASGAAKDSATQDQWRMRILAIDEETNRPIRNVRIGVQLGDETTWQDGADNGQTPLTLPSRTPRYCYLKIRADGYVPMRAFWRNSKDAPADKLPEEFAFPMAKAATVGGRVVDDEGKPVPGATVLFSAGDSASHQGRRAELSFSKEEYVTDKDGRWDCNIAPPRMNHGSINVDHPDFGVVPGNWSVDDKIDELRDKSYVWTLKRGVAVLGTVVGPDGKPVEGAVLAIGELNVYPDKGPFQKTDADGKYEFKRVAPTVDLPPNANPNNRMTITVIKPGFAPVMKSVSLVGETAGKTHRIDGRIINFKLWFGKTVRIRVENSDGEPLKGAWVLPDDWRDTRPFMAMRQFGIPRETDEDGIWEWTWAPADDPIKYDIMASGYMDVRDYEISARNNLNEVTITLKRPQVITGRAIDAETKKPIDDFVVQHGFEGFNKEPDGVYWATATDARGRNGHYTKSMSMPTHRGSYRYRVLADGYEPAVSNSVPFAEGEVTLDFALKRQAE
ncbi:MAG: hypothetical protein HYX69_19005 [Planctomycetia bacterium]|nr:hypothetical protein [Planctomycetia bacterium]